MEAVAQVSPGGMKLLHPGPPVDLTARIVSIVCTPGCSKNQIDQDGIKIAVRVPLSYMILLHPSPPIDPIAGIDQIARLQGCSGPWIN
jgi:hypothetical protein